MSIVGTRPPLISETNLYEPRHKARLAIKPGITGMWQVSGRSDITDFEEVVRLDKEYIENWDINYFFQKRTSSHKENRALPVEWAVPFQCFVLNHIGVRPYEIETKMQLMELV